MSEITVIRHSMALANEQGILMGAKLDSPLSDHGVDLANQKGVHLKAAGYKPNLIYTSELLRAKQTAEIIMRALGISIPIVNMPQLNERDFGVYDGKAYNFVLEAFEKEGPDPDTIEPVDIFIARVLEGLERIKTGATDKTLIVTHSNPEMVIQTAVQHPNNLQRFWELGDPPYCEGFTYSY